MTSHDIPENWEETPLKKIAKIIMGQSPDSSTCNQENKGYSFLQGNAEFGAINPKSIIFCSKPKKLSKKGDVLISVRAPVGDLNIADKDYCIGRGVAALEAGKDIDSRFLFYSLFLSRQYLFRVMQGTTFEAVNKTDLERMKISKPELMKEQYKIASILLAIDKAIENTKALIEKKKKIKEGLMQAFFSNNGKNDIIDIELGNAEYFGLKTGGTPSTSIPEYWGGNVKWMTSGDIHKKIIYDVEGRLTEKGYNNSNAITIPIDSILLSYA